MKKVIVSMIIISILLMSFVQPAFAVDDASSVMFPNVTNMLKVAMGACAVLIASTVFQVGDQIDANVEASKIVARTVFTSMETEILDWWNTLSADDKTAYEEKVRSDNDLTLVEALPSSIITSAISSSLQYKNLVNTDILQTYRLINSSTYGVMTIDRDTYLHLYQMDNDSNYSLSKLYWYRYNNDWVLANALDGATYTLTLKDNRVYKYTIEGIWEYYNTSGHDSNSWYTPTRVVMFESYDSVIDGPMTYYTSLKGTIDSVVALDSAYANWNPDNQQDAPFYYPVDVMSIGSAVDTSIVGDDDIGNIDTYFPAVMSAGWDYSAGSVSDTAIPLSYDGSTGTLTDTGTGNEVTWGTDTPWMNDAGTGADTGTGTGNLPYIDTPTKKLNFDPFRNLGEQLLGKFPFCIPYDIYATLLKFQAVPDGPPKFTVTETGGNVMEIELEIPPPYYDYYRGGLLLIMVMGFYIWIGEFLLKG